MSRFPATKAKKVLAALLRLGWTLKRQGGSHRTLAREAGQILCMLFMTGEEIGPKMMFRIAKNTGLTPSDL